MIPIFDRDNNIAFELKLGRKFLYNPSSKIRKIAVYDTSLDDSKEIKLFIKDIYARYYGAEINITYPYLMALHDKNDNVLAAVGFRAAMTEKLFLEQYLDDKIEMIVSHHYHKEISRSQIVEVGSLASKGNGMSQFLFVALATYLQTIGHSYAAMTGTFKLRRSFQRLRLQPKIICAASEEKLTQKDEDWGTYYDYEPQVMIGNIETGCHTLKTVLNITVEPSLTKLYPHE